MPNHRPDKDGSGKELVHACMQVKKMNETIRIATSPRFKIHCEAKMDVFGEGSYIVPNYKRSPFSERFDRRTAEERTTDEGMYRMGKW